MTSGVLSAFLLLFSLLLEETVIAALPTPWREIALPLLFGILIMYRVSVSMGAAFLLLSGIFTALAGLGGAGIVLAYTAAALSGVLLSTWVFARRSLAAMGGFALLTAGAYALVRAVLEIGGDLQGGYTVYPGNVLLHVLFTVIASAIAVVFLSLAYTSFVRAFGDRFIRKNTSYEVRGGE